MEDVLKWVEKEFPNHTFEVIDGKVYIDNILASYSYHRAVDEGDLYFNYHNEKDYKEALHNQLIKDIQKEIDKRG